MCAIWQKRPKVVLYWHDHLQRTVPLCTSPQWCLLINCTYKLICLWMRCWKLLLESTTSMGTVFIVPAHQYVTTSKRWQRTTSVINLLVACRHRESDAEARWDTAVQPLFRCLAEDGGHSWLVKRLDDVRKWWAKLQRQQQHHNCNWMHSSRNSCSSPLCTKDTPKDRASQSWNNH